MKNTCLLNLCCSSVQIEKKKEKNVIKNKDYEHKTIIQRTQNSHDYYVYNINNRSVELISSNEIIWKKKSFSLIKFSNEEFSNTQY